MVYLGSTIQALDSPPKPDSENHNFDSRCLLVDLKSFLLMNMQKH